MSTSHIAPDSAEPEIVAAIVAAQPGTHTPPVYASHALFQGGKVIFIVHDGREYQLRITQAGKLILTA